VNMLRWSPVLMAACTIATGIAWAETAQSQDRIAIGTAASMPQSDGQRESIAIIPVPDAVMPVAASPMQKAGKQLAQKAIASPPSVEVAVEAAVEAVDNAPKNTVPVVAQVTEDAPPQIRLSPNQAPTGSPSVNTPPLPATPETSLPPSTIELPPSSTTAPATPFAPGQPPASPTTPPSTPPATPAAEPRVLVAEVAVKGATGNLEDEVYRAIRTRPGQTTTRSQLQEDINAIFATGFFANVQASPEDTPLGVRVNYVVEPNPVLKSVQVQGNKAISTQEIEAIFQPQYGTILNLRQLQQGVQALTKQYQDRGYVLAQVVDVPKISPDGVVTLDLAEGEIESVQIKYVNKDGSDKDDKGNPIKGRTRDFIVTREMETKPGKTFNKTIAERDLQRIFGLSIFDDINLGLDPGEDPRKVNVVIKVAERSAGSLGAGAGISSANGLFGTVSYQQQNLGGNNQKLGAELQLGQKELLFDANFTDPWIAGDPYRTGYTINGFRRRSVSLIFDGGDEVRILNNGSDRDRPRIVRSGGGISFTRPLSKEVFKRSPLTASLGFQYQQIRLQDADGDLINPLSPQVNNDGIAVGLGKDLSFSGESKDDLFTVQFGLVNDRRNSPTAPTSGSLFRIGTEQSIPIGKGNIFFNRLQANYSFYLPTRLLKISPACRDVNTKLVLAARPKVGDCNQAFAFNVKAGTVLGDLPPYEAFSLGGSNSVRGYEEGEIGSGKSFVQATAEYRFPLFSIVSGALFVDAATDFGTGNSVKGDPAGLRNKPGSGLGYGLGVRVQTPFFGAIRVDYAFNDQGDGRFHFGIGERF
jgi:outer membrane protein insertion porin family